MKNKYLSPSTSLKLWYRQPARQWEEALPLGNGRLGVMVFGGLPLDRLQLNEDTLGSGGPKDWNNPSARWAITAISTRCGPTGPWAAPGCASTYGSISHLMATLIS